LRVAAAGWLAAPASIKNSAWRTCDEDGVGG
jgi:hypothetical protein